MYDAQGNLVKHNTVTKHLLPSAPRLSKPLPPVPFFNNVPSAPTSYHVPPSVTTVATHALPPSLPTKALPPLPPSQTLYPSLSKALAPLIPSKPALSKPFSIPQYYPNVKSNDPAELGLMVFVYSCDQAQQGTVKDNRGNLLYTFQKEGDCIALLDTLDQVVIRGEQAIKDEWHLSIPAPHETVTATYKRHSFSKKNTLNIEGKTIDSLKPSYTKSSRGYEMSYYAAYPEKVAKAKILISCLECHLDHWR